MTRKEAAGVIKFEKACVLRQDTPRCNRDCKKCDLLLPTEDVLTAYDMAIKALEQQPCDDCISRQAVDELSKELVHIVRDKADFLCNFWERLQKLPPVTPQPKTGHWNRVTDNAGYWVWECDKCVWQQRFNTNYCPNCGAKMQGVEENDN